MEGYTEIVKLAESALNVDSEKSKVWINKFIEKYSSILKKIIDELPNFDYAGKDDILEQTLKLIFV